MKRGWVGFVVGLALVAISPATANAGLTIEITGARATNAVWTQGVVDNITASYPDFAPTQTPYGYITGWSAVVVATPIANGCPDSVFDDGANWIWTATTQTSPRTISSGRREFVMDGAYGQRLCSYGLTQFREGFIFDGRIGGSTIEPFSPSPPMPVSEAAARAKKILAKRYGRSWRSGTRKRVSCVEQASSFTCRGTWTFRGKKRSGVVSVVKP